jgi:RHS repeat-associated protein
MQLDGRSMNYGQMNDKYKFTGKERDNETGYDYFGARYYDSKIGRWMSVDSLAGEEGLFNWSPYHYSFNNPLRFKDLKGKTPVVVIGGVALGAAELVTLGLLGTATVLSAMGSDKVANDMRTCGSWVDNNISKPIIDVGVEGYEKIKETLENTFSSQNTTAKNQIEGLANGPITEHLDKLEGRGTPSQGNPRDPRNQEKWKAHIKKALDNISKRLNKLNKPLQQVLRERGWSDEDIEYLVKRLSDWKIDIPTPQQ